MQPKTLSVEKKKSVNGTLLKRQKNSKLKIYSVLLGNGKVLLSNL